jgi:hypothetical protein
MLLKHDGTDLYTLAQALQALQAQVDDLKARSANAPTPVEVTIEQDPDEDRLIELYEQGWRIISTCYNPTTPCTEVYFERR